MIGRLIHRGTGVLDDNRQSGVMLVDTNGFSPARARRHKQRGEPVVAMCRLRIRAGRATLHQMKQYKKLDFPTDEARRYLEPGPIVLVSSMHYHGKGIFTVAGETINLHRLFSKWRDV